MDSPALGTLFDLAAKPLSAGLDEDNADRIHFCICSTGRTGSGMRAHRHRQVAGAAAALIAARAI